MPKWKKDIGLICLKKNIFKQIKHVFLDSNLYSWECIQANHKGKVQDMQ